MVKWGNIMTYSEIISKRILFLCNERKITVNKLATLSGMKQSTLENVIKCNTNSLDFGLNIWYNCFNTVQLQGE